MEVKVTSSTMLTSPISHPSDVPLTVFDRFAANIHIAVLYTFTTPTSTNADIISGLSKTLFHFPTLTSYLTTNSHGRPSLTVGGPDGGALVVEATVSSKLEDHLPLTPSPDFRLLHPEVKDAKHFLQVQLNRFQCGGLIIGVTAHHRVADGKSMSTFFVSWGKMVRGVPIDPLPAYDQSWLKPRDPPLVQFDHWGTDFIPISPQPNHEFSVTPVYADPSEITNMLLHFSPEFIIKLKAQTSASSTVKYTTFQTLLGHLWRMVTIARQLDDEECTMVRVSVNGRPRLQPPVSPEFFGNLVLNAYPKAEARALIEGGVAMAAGIVREAVRVVGEDYFRSFIDLGEVYGDGDLVPCYDAEGNVISPKLEVDSWLGFPFDHVDFGGGALCAFLPTWVPVEGLLIFIPALLQDGGVDVFVSLLEKHAGKFREISHSLD